MGIGTRAITVVPAPGRDSTQQLAVDQRQPLTHVDQAETLASRGFFLIESNPAVAHLQLNSVGGLTTRASRRASAQVDGNVPRSRVQHRVVDGLLEDVEQAEGDFARKVVWQAVMAEVDRDFVLPGSLLTHGADGGRQPEVLELV